MRKFSDEKIKGIAGTVLVHVVLGLLLYFLVLRTPPTPPEKGVEVMLGVDIEDGTVDQPAVASKPVVNTPPPPTPPVDNSKADEPVITQDIEESVVLPTDEPKKAQPKKEKPKETVKPKKPEKTPEQIQQEKEEAERKERERIEKETRENAENSIANAFSKASKMNEAKKTEEKEASAGSPDGNSNAGQKSGVGIGFDLEGRQPGSDGLAVPVYDVQDEGTIVVAITVAPDGRVLLAEIDRTINANKKLRDAAVNAAKNTRFNSIDGLNNQHGTITYNFKLTR
jgi:TonB family protein